ncbi:MAG: hypothetical protein WCE21_00990 [Candidatus Babeliales bacterium]
MRHTHCLLIVCAIASELFSMQSYQYKPGCDIVTIHSLERAIRMNDRDYLLHHRSKIQYAFKYLTQEERAELLYEAQVNKEKRADLAVDRQHQRKIKTLGALGSIALTWSVIMHFESAYETNLLKKAYGVYQWSWQKDVSSLSNAALFMTGLAYIMDSCYLSAHHPVDKAKSIYSDIEFFSKEAELALRGETMPEDS